MGSLEYYRCQKEGSEKNWYAKNDRGDKFEIGKKAYVDSPPHRKKVIVVEKLTQASDIPKRKTIHWLYPKAKA